MTKSDDRTASGASFRKTDQIPATDMKSYYRLHPGRIQGPRLEQAFTRTDLLLDQAQQLECQPTLSLVLPAYNAERWLPAALCGLLTLQIDKEILVIDDGSTDATRLTAAQLADRHHEISVLRHDHRRGPGAALQTGVAAALGEVVVVLDGNRHYDAKDIVMLIKPILAGCCDVVYGSHHIMSQRQNGSWWTQTRNHLLATLSNFCTGQQLSCPGGTMKAFRRTVIQEMKIRQNYGGIEAELIAKLSLREKRIYEMPLSSRESGPLKTGSLWETCLAAWFIIRHTVSR